MHIPSPKVVYCLYNDDDDENPLMCPLASLTGACASSSPCHVNAQCSNVQGSYNCKCNDGYLGDGHRCCKLVDGELPSMPIGSAMTSSCA